MAAESSEPSGSKPLSRAQQREVHRVGAVHGAARAARPGRRRGRARRAARPRVDPLDLLAGRRRRCSTSIDDAAGLGQVRRAGDVGDQPAGPDGVERRVRAARAAARPAPATSSGCRRQRASGRRRSAPEPGARRVDEHPVERRRPPGRRPARRRRRPSAVVRRRRGAPARPGAARSRRPAARAPRPPASAPSSAALPPGPAHRSSQRWSGPSSGAAASASATSWLPSSCTPARPSRTAASAPGSPPGSTAAYGDQRPGLGAGRDELGHAWPGPGRATRVTCGGALSAASSAAVSLQRAAEGVAQRRDDPARVRVHDREVADRVGVVRRRDLGQPAVEVLPADLAQHRVDEAAAALAGDRPGQLDGGADRGVRRHPHREQLVGAEPQQVEHRRVDLVQRPVDAGGQHRVVRPAAAQRAVGRARWRTRRRGRRGRARAAAPAASGWRRRPARRPRAAGRTRPGAAASGRGLPPARRPALLPLGAAGRSPQGRRRRGRARRGPSRPPPSACLPGRAHLAEPDRLAVAGADQDLPLAGGHLTGRELVAGATSRDADRLDRAEAEPLAAPRWSRRPAPACRPGPAGRRGRPAPTSRPGRPRRSSLGARLTPSAGCGTRHQLAALDARRGWRTSRPAPAVASRPSRSPLVSRGPIGSVITPTAPGRCPGPPRGEHRRAGDVVAVQDRVLHRARRRARRAAARSAG